MIDDDIMIYSTTTINWQMSFVYKSTWPLCDKRAVDTNLNVSSSDSEAKNARDFYTVPF